MKVEDTYRRSLLIVAALLLWRTTLLVWLKYSRQLSFSMGEGTIQFLSQSSWDDNEKRILACAEGKTYLLRVLRTALVVALVRHSEGCLRLWSAVSYLIRRGCWRGRERERRTICCGSLDSVVMVIATMLYEYERCCFVCLLWCGDGGREGLAFGLIMWYPIYLRCNNKRFARSFLCIIPSLWDIWLGDIWLGDIWLRDIRSDLISHTHLFNAQLRIPF